MNLEELNHLFDDDEDEDIIPFIFNIRSYVIRDRPNYLQLCTDEEFYHRFRFTKNTVMNKILPNIEPILITNVKRAYDLDVLSQLLLTLRFYASGNFYITIGDFCGVYKTTAGRIIKKVTQALVSLRANYVKFPDNDNEKRKVVAGFYAIANFPKVIGAIDCTHIRIQSPGSDNAEFFRNRKGFFSLNVQVICDSNYYIMDIISRWPGSCHDSYIFQNSSVYNRFNNGEFGDNVLLGDSGYPLKNFLMTPLANPQNQGETRYNNAHISTRTVVERTIGIWKRIFPVLSLGIRCNISLTQQIIIATAILHNLRILEKESYIEDIEQEEFHDVIEADEVPNRINLVQQKFIHYFSNQ